MVPQIYDINNVSSHLMKSMMFLVLICKEEKEEIRLIPMTKAPKPNKLLTAAFWIGAYKSIYKYKFICYIFRYSINKYRRLNNKYHRFQPSLKYCWFSFF